MKIQTKVPGMSLYPGTGRHWWEQVTAPQVQALARETERLGFDVVAVPDHLVMDSGSAPELGAHWVHSLCAAGVLVGATSTITVVPLVVVPYHHPVELAKALSTLDFLSGGRVVPQLLVGYNAKEFEVLGADHARRGAVTDEYLDAALELLYADAPAFAGPTVRFDEIVFAPRPSRPLTLWFGGRTRAALRRIARHGDGWIAYATPRKDFRALCDYIREQPAFLERPRPLELSIELFEGHRDPITHRVVQQAAISLEPDAILHEIDELAAMGATLVDVSDVLGMGKFQNGRPDAPPPTRSFADQIERLQWFAAEILPEAKQITPAVS